MHPTEVGCIYLHLYPSNRDHPVTRVEVATLFGILMPNRVAAMLAEKKWRVPPLWGLPITLHC